MYAFQNEIPLKLPTKSNNKENYTFTRNFIISNQRFESISSLCKPDR